MVTEMVSALQRPEYGILYEMVCPAGTSQILACNIKMVFDLYTEDLPVDPFTARLF